MLTRPLERRGSERAPLVGVARIAQRRFEILDLSFGGLGLVGNACTLQVGWRVLVTLSTTFAPNVELSADVRRIDERGFGLAWTPHQDLSRVIHLVDLAMRHASTASSERVPQT